MNKSKWIIAAAAGATLAAVAAGLHTDVPTAMFEMSELGDVYRSNPAVTAGHQNRFGAFEMLQAVGRTIQSTAAQTGPS